ncbi:MAG: hypothetical protein ACMUIP_05460 [bacterium]
MSNKNSFILTIFVLFIGLTLFSTILMNHTRAESEFEKWKNQELASFQEFKDKRDKEFTRFLNRQWKEFKLFAGHKIYEKPKPVKSPVAPLKEAGKKEAFGGKIIEKIPVTEPEKEIKEPSLDKKPIIKEPHYEIPGESVTIDFFGISITTAYDPLMKINLKGKIDKKTISSSWEKLSKTHYESTLNDIQRYKNDLQLNDWGYYFLIHNIANGIYGEKNANEIELFTWFILTKSGYEARIGYNENKINLLLPSNNTIFGAPFIQLGTKNYYAISFDETQKHLGSLYTYNGSYPEADHLMDNNIRVSPHITNTMSTKILDFSYQGKHYEIPVTFNEKLVEFFRFYPQTNFTIYFSASVSDEAAASLIKGLKPHILGKTEGEAVNFLLRFMQTAFEYKTDAEQFGREKYLLSEETLYYPFSDCEDRSFLFAFLVNKLTGLDVIGLHYPNHLATAVRFTDDIKGDSIVNNGTRYIICDPTYINADIGMAMPRFKNITPKIITFNRAT